jgi:hypothetical protein
LWHSARIGNRTEVVHGGFFDEFVRRMVKGMTGSIVGVTVAIALCD